MRTILFLIVSLLVMNSHYLIADDEIVPQLSVEQPFLVDAKYLNFLNEGLQEANLQNYSKALEYFSAAVKYKPNMAVAYLYRGDLYKRLGKDKLSIEDYKSANLKADELIKFNLNPINYYERGYSHNKLGKKDKAYDDYTIACDQGVKLACTEKKQLQLDVKRNKKWVNYGYSQDVNYFYDKTSIKKTS